MSQLSVPPTSLVGQNSNSLASARMKVELQPGHSLIDWIRFTGKSTDLTGTGNKIIDVTPEELEKHKEQNDCWMSLRGKVYNVSSYMDYHPGGVDELMRGAGIDATDLFNEIHRWVNYDSMLAKCYVGPVVSGALARKKPSTGQSGATFLSPSTPSSLSKPLSSITTPFPAVITSGTDTLPGVNAKREKPKISWHQSGRFVTIVVHTKSLEISRDQVIVDLHNGTDLLLHIYIGLDTFLVHYQLYERVNDTYKINISEEEVTGEPGKLMLSLEKHGSSREWPHIGSEASEHATLRKTKDMETYFRSCEILSVARVTADTRLYCLRLPRGSMMNIPVGHHVYLSAQISGMNIVRPYTVVQSSLMQPPDTAGTLFYLMIKLYDNGALTSHLSTLTPGVSVSVSNHEGTFKASVLSSYEFVVMLAAGTGFTPMIRVIHTLSDDKSSQTRSLLLFFNKTEADIPWRDQLDTLSREDDRLQVHHILSQAPSSWPGRMGRVGRALLSELMSEVLLLDASKYLVCVCGPTPFTTSTLKILSELNVKATSIHAFT